MENSGKLLENCMENRGLKVLKIELVSLLLGIYPKEWKAES